MTTSSSGPSFAERSADRLKHDRERYFDTRRLLTNCPDRAAESSRLLEKDVCRLGQDSRFQPILNKVLHLLGEKSGAGSAVFQNLNAQSSAQKQKKQVLCLQLSQASTEEERAQSSATQVIVKVGPASDIRREFQSHLWASSVFAEERVPKLLLQAEVCQGEEAAFVTEFVCASGQCNGQALCLADFLLCGLGAFAFEDARANCLQSPALASSGMLSSLSWPVDIPSNTRPHIAQVRSIASQIGQMLGVLRKQPIPSECSQTAPGAVTDSLFDIAPALHRRILHSHHSTASPLHPSLRDLTQRRFSDCFGANAFDAMIQAVSSLYARLDALRRQGSTSLPPMSLPLTWAQNRLTARHNLLSTASEADGNFVLRIGSWSGLSPSGPFSDLSMLLTSLLFETVRVPVLLEDLVSSTCVPGVGPAVYHSLCAKHLSISEETAARMLQVLQAQGDCSGRAQSTESQTSECPETSPDLQPDEPILTRLLEEIAAGSSSDAAKLFAFVRDDPKVFIDSALEAKKMSDAMCDWTLPRRLIKNGNSLGMVPRLDQPPSRRQRGDTPLRAMQWGWQAVREFRDAVEKELPSVAGDVPELWPVLWLLPSLQFSLQLLDSPNNPWQQKIWILYHIGSICRRLNDWLDAVYTKQAALQVHLSE